VPQRSPSLSSSPLPCLPRADFCSDPPPSLSTTLVCLRFGPQPPVLPLLRVASIPLPPPPPRSSRIPPLALPNWGPGPPPAGFKIRFWGGLLPQIGETLPVHSVRRCPRPPSFLGAVFFRGWCLDELLRVLRIGPRWGGRQARRRRRQGLAQGRAAGSRGGQGRIRCARVPNWIWELFVPRLFAAAGRRP